MQRFTFHESVRSGVRCVIATLSRTRFLRINPALRNIYARDPLKPRFRPAHGSAISQI
jgi:hypothetical protein